MDENEPLDVKDFPLFESNDVEYYTYTIVTDKTNKPYSEHMFANKTNVSPRKIDEEQLDTSPSATMQIKMEPDDYSINIIDSSENDLKDCETPPNATNYSQNNTGKNCYNTLK